MSLLYNNANKQTQQLRKDLDLFEKDPIGSPISIIGQITTTLTTLSRTLKDFQDYIEKQTLSLNEGAKLKNETRLQNLNNELMEYKLKFQSLKKQREQGLAEQSKAKLFTTAVSENPYGEDISMTNRRGFHDDQSQGQPQQQQQQKYSGMSMEEGLYKEQNSLDKSNQQLDDILEMGRQAFDDLVEQNELIADMRERMGESLENLGFSQVTIRKVQRKLFEDKWLFYIGALLTLYIMYLIYHYLG
ncbi:unnamed protein product [Ambrosiozyma monospora]|uniref:Unnamed protein product n=1 Tax=Ambrosiozyma monospora TaxID=43982 RepID=A0ACB5TPG6_AMBMO|nr:unnamed protein product [Ambrosiozyma monospora]